jgi:hypothetical protein
VRRLTGRQWAALGIGAAAVLGTILLVGVFAPRWWNGEGGTYAPGRPIAASTRLDPSRTLFGDVVTAHVRVVVDDREVDPETVRVYPDFRPYRVASFTRELRHDVGRGTAIDYSFRLDCVVVSCLTAFEVPDTEPARPKALRFVPARVQARDHHGAFVNARATWPDLFVRPRLTPDEVSVGEAAVDRYVAPEVTWRVPPDVAGGILVALAAALALGGGYLVATGVRGRPVPRRLLIPSHLTPVDRALALARHAAEHGDAEGGRRALERLATELRRSGEPELAGSVGRVAWSHDAPTRDDVDALADELGVSRNGR